MDNHDFKVVILTLAMIFTKELAIAMQHCPNCGRMAVPYPLSTKPSCGDPWYRIRCTAGTLWLDAQNNSSYIIKEIHPQTQRMIIHTPSLTRKTCISSDYNSEGIHLYENGPFSITSSNTVLLLNCTSAMLHLQVPINCSGNSICHSYILDEAADCRRTSLCCVFNTGGVTAYFVRVHSGGCAAFQSFVNFDSAGPVKRWPAPGLELQWVLPQERLCKNTKDCNDSVNSKCLIDRANSRQMRCFCNKNFQWDPVNGMCQNVKCRKGKRCSIHKKRTALIAGMALAAGAFLVAIGTGTLAYKKRLHLQKQAAARRSLIREREDILKTVRTFTEKEMTRATNNFSKDNLIGTGGFGEVFKGILDDGTVTAIKRSRLERTNSGSTQVLNEVRILCQVNHRNLVRLLGCCIELEHPLLVYEYVPNGTLFDYLHNQDSEKWVPLNWQRRLLISHQTAQALAYLHFSAVPPIYHRDVKSTNILLDENLDAKVSDFGLSRLVDKAEANNTYIVTSAQGTLGYLDPEYYRSFQLTDKSDVYSFGVVLLELLTCKRAIDFTREDEDVNLVLYSKKIIDQERLMDVVDPVLKDNAKEVELETMNAFGLLAAACLDERRQNRPSMKEVADEIEYIINVNTGDSSKV